MELAPIGQGAISPDSTNRLDLGDDEEEELLSSDPKLNLQAQLIRKMFGHDEDKSPRRVKPPEAPETKEPPKADSVEFSTASLEMYRRDGARVTFARGNERIEVSYEREEYLRVEMTNGQPQQVQEAEPLVLDLDGNGLDLTDVTRGEGVAFDITGDGVAENVSWVAPNDGFLVYDRNGNGLIDNGRELFGDQYGARNGFEELAKFDSDASGSIDSSDAVYSQLGVWRDLNRNGVSEEGETRSLADYGIASISLTPDGTVDTIAGNRVEGYGSYTGAAATGRVGEVYLNYLA